MENPSEYMLSGKPEGASGSIVTCSMEETQPDTSGDTGSCMSQFFNNPRRTANGTDYNKVNLLMAVLEKRANLSLSDCERLCEYSRRYKDERTGDRPWDSACNRIKQKGYYSA